MTLNKEGRANSPILKKPWLYLCAFVICYNLTVDSQMLLFQSVCFQIIVILASVDLLKYDKCHYYDYVYFCMKIHNFCKIWEFDSFFLFCEASLSVM